MRKSAPFLLALSVLSFLFFLFLPDQSSQQQGPTRYVNNTDPACGGKSPCYTTIQAAVNAALPGETIQIQAGVYHEKILASGKNNTTTATESSRIVIEADPLSSAGGVVIAGASSVCTNGYAFQLQQSKFITIRGLTISGAGGQAISLLGGINQNQAIHIEQNRIFGNGSSECNGGITIARGNPDTLIVNNLIYANGRNGITFIDADGGPHYIVENTIHANQWSGVSVARSHELFLVNNVITQNGTAAGSTGGRFGVSREASTAPQPQGITLLNNLICGNRLGEINGPALDATDSGNLTPQGTQGPGVSASPGCEIPANVYANVNGTDGLPNTADDNFALASSSPAIDRGMDPRTLGLNVLFNSIFEADFSTDATRPSDGNADRVVLFDMGAFEFPNAPPVANAGPDQSVFTGTLVTLNGSQSQDPEGATLTFQWTIVSQPAGSSASLSNPTSVAPQFTPLVAGTYTIQLVVNDGQLDSAPDAVTVTARVNNPPTANANGPYTGAVGVPIQFTGTGSDPDGDPIIFSWSFGDGGTAIGANSTHAYAIAGTFTVTLTVTDSFGAVGTSQTTATVNQGLVLNPIGDKTVNLGETLIFTVSATSTSETPNLFVSPLPLPNHATFNAVTGEFRFTPDTTQVGSFPLTFSAVSGGQSVSETITITVPQPPPGGVTTLRGKVENLNDTPLGNVKVTLRATGRTAFSGVDGIFFLDGIPSGRQELIVNGREANLGVFAILAVPVDLIDGVLNNLASAITLPDVDVAAEVPVSQAATTVVANPNVPGVALTIPPATATNSDGTPYTGKLSINPVPDYGRPESRPEELRPGMAITIQPAGVRFNPPARLTFPNADGMVPGSELNLWSLSPDTGTFSIVGKGAVTQDGQSIVTTEGGVRASAWHFFLPPGGSSDTDVDESPGLSEYPDKECHQPASSTVALQSGCLGVDFALPSYRSLGTSRSVKFVYKSNRANPQPVIPFNATIPVRAAVPPRLSYSLSVGGVEQGIETFINTSGLDENRDETIRAVASFDASQLKSGVYPYRIKLTSNYLNSAISSFISDKVLVVNEQKSPFGAGWAIEGLGKLNFNADGSVVVTDGNGSAITFRREVLGQVSWWPGDGDANDIAGSNHGTLQNGATFAAGKVGQAFSLDGVDDYVQIEHNPSLDPGPGSFTITAWVKTANTGSQVVVSKYECGQFCPSNVANSAYFLQTGGGRFAVAIRDSDAGGPPETGEFQFFTGTRFIADSNFHHVVLVRNIASQQLQLYVDGVLDASAPLNAGATGALKDDDGEADPLLIGASIIGGQTTKTSFFSGLIDEVQVYNRALSASEIQLLFSSPGQPLLAANFTTPAGDFSTLVKNSDDTFTRSFRDGTKINFNTQGLETSVVDRSGNTTSYSYDGSGRLISITDPAGLITSFSYAGSLVSSVTDPSGKTTTFTTGATGNLTKVTFPDGSFKSFGYDSRHLMTSETNERGLAVQREYDSLGRLIRATLPDGTAAAPRALRVWVLLTSQPAWGR